MIKNGGNGSFRVVFPLVRLVSLLRGFNSSRIHFLNFFNDPRIIREQRIAAYKGYRGGVLRSRGGRIARWKVFRGVWVSRLENGQQGGDVAFLVTKGGKIFMLAVVIECSLDSGRIWVDGIRCATQIDRRGLMIGVFRLKKILMRVEYPQELFSAVDLLSLQFLVVNSWNLLTLGLRYFPFDPQIVVLISLLYSHRWEMHIHQDKICQLKYHVHRLLLFPQHICFERILILVRSNHSGRVLVSLLALCHGSSLGFQGCSKNRMSSLPDGIQIRECDAKALRGYGMIHEDGDNDTNDGDDDGRER
ncbi:hypothetical protein Tco_0773842 [Tanacetum coccineum]|uniref:Uncharacterized protein n=1 Tax=Tanacetum coccineum TaxID=301880 RepID=A0ABQ4ZN73_9ASTR